MTDGTSAADAIRSLLARLAHATDTAELDEYLAFFSDDAVLEAAGQPPARGRVEIEARARRLRDAGTIGPGSRTRHAVTTVSVDVDAGGRGATSRSAWLLVGRTDEGSHVLGTGEYRDRFVEAAGTWQIARRELVRDD
jgi:3-phenylpropionate/cinnamic acid dioxygenase small subunit